MDISIVDNLKDNIYFAIIFGSVSAIMILIFARDKVVFKVDNNSGFFKILFVAISVTILVFFISIMMFDINTVRQGVLVSFSVVSFSVVSFVSNNKEIDTNFFNGGNS